MWSISRLFELIFNVNHLFKRIECEKKLICSMLNIQSSVLLKRQKDNNFMHFYISKHLCLYIMWQNVSKTCQTVYTINFLVWFNPPFLKFSNTLYNIFTWKIFSDLLSLAEFKRWIDRKIERIYSRMKGDRLATSV